MSKYVMDNKKEVERLEAQARLKNYSLEEEFQFLELNAYKKVIDAGCGSGLLGRFLTNLNPGIQYVGCDASLIRLEGARILSPGLQFEQVDLYQIEDFKKLGQFDLVVNRYVLHHLPDSFSVIKNFHTALAPKGLCYIVDIDGLLVNMGTNDQFVQQCLLKIKQQFYGRFENARNIPAQMSDAGFKNVQWKVQLMEFQGEEKANEYEQFKERFQMAESFLIQYLGDVFTYKKFYKKFFEEMKKPEVCLFYNKIISWGKKD